MREKSEQDDLAATVTQSRDSVEFNVPSYVFWFKLKIFNLCKYNCQKDILCADMHHDIRLQSGVEKI